MTSPAPGPTTGPATGSGPKLFSFPAGAPFADWLAAFVLDRHGSDPLALAEVIVLLPTRRAVRALQEAFLRAGEGRPTLLPLMRPLGDLDDEEPGLAPIWPGLATALPPAIGGLERKLILTRLIQARDESRGGGLPAGTALRLADALADLLDEAATEDRDLEGLEALVPAEFAAHWQEVLAFLDILRGAWPAILAERGLVDPAARRSAGLRRLAALWAEAPPQRPIYAAGSTGSIPATADLLACVARLPQGAVILPGLDRDSPDEEWQAIGAAPTHPQFMLHRLLRRLELPRAAVQGWQPAGRDVAPAAAARAALARRALAPAERTDLWLAAGAPPEAAFDGLQRLEAATAAEEAGAIALLMRQALERPGRTVALVTPDRNLARRVQSALERWDLEVDDSAGRPLAGTPPAVFLRLAAAAMAADLAPIPLLSLLKHPLARLGRERAEHLRLTRQLERAVLRGSRPPPGLAGLRATAERQGLVQDAAMMAWLQDLAVAVAAGAALSPASGRRGTAPARLLDAHLALAEVLAAEDRPALLAASNEEAAGTPPPPSPIWAGEAGNALAGLLADLRGGIATLGAMLPGEWPDFLDAVLQDGAVRPAFGRHPRLFIWGPLEARLQSADLMILGGLNEGTWPGAAQEDPWMSRPMRTAFGLPSPERRIGQAAHDFVQAFACSEVVLSRANKVEGTPTVPSRWLLRLAALLDRERPWQDAAAGPARAWLQAMDAPAAVTPAPAPRPCPPVAARPRRMSVTRVEDWIRDPYASYARFVLGLEALRELDPDPAASDRGVVVHDALERFIAETMDRWPDDPVALLERIGRESFGDLLDVPHVAVFWWPWFRRVAAWFAAFEAGRRSQGMRPLAVEAKGRMLLESPAGPFELTARADRIDMAPGGPDILDYKTGMPPSAKQVASGLSPQLPLEGAILAAGGFEGLPAAAPAAFTYVRLSGGRESGSSREVADGAAADLAAAALDGLRRRIAIYDRPDTPYLSRPRPEWLNRPGDYDHLARVAEWQGGEDPE
ncbi:MAG: double-strand break repair protein AddB [Sneathiellaceae bacterium]